jgi:hypothetical protein
MTDCRDWQPIWLAVRSRSSSPAAPPRMWPRQRRKRSQSSSYLAKIRSNLALWPVSIDRAAISRG